MAASPTSLKMNFFLLFLIVNPATFKPQLGKFVSTDAIENRHLVIWNGECVDYSGAMSKFSFDLKGKRLNTGNNKYLCREKCEDKSDDYKAIGLSQTKCYCMLEPPPYDKQVPSVDCSTLCPGNSAEKCGGPGIEDRRANVYQLESSELEEKFFFTETWREIGSNFFQLFVGTGAWAIGYGISEGIRKNHGNWSTEGWDAVWKKDGVWPHVFQNVYNWFWTSAAMLLQTIPKAFGRSMTETETGMATGRYSEDDQELELRDLFSVN